jgi:hypothetical protein
MRSKPGTRGGFRPPHGGAVRLRHARLGAVPHRLLLRVAMGMLAGAVALATATVVAERVRTEAAVLTLADQGLMWQATLGRPGATLPAFVAPGSQAAQWARYLDTSAALPTAIPARLVSARIERAVVLDRTITASGGSVRYQVTEARRLLVGGRPTVSRWTAVVTVTVARQPNGRLLVTGLEYDFDPPALTAEPPTVSYLDTDLKAAANSPLGE